MPFLQVFIPLQHHKTFSLNGHMCVFACGQDTHAHMYTSGEPLPLFSLGAQPLTGRQCEHSKQKPGSLNWPLTRSCRQVVVAKRTVSVSAQWAHCGPQAAALQDMSSVSLLSILTHLYVIPQHLTPL